MTRALTPNSLASPFQKRTTAAASRPSQRSTSVNDVGGTDAGQAADRSSASMAGNAANFFDSLAAYTLTIYAGFVIGAVIAVVVLM